MEPKAHPIHRLYTPDFSVVPFRLNFMLFSEENHVKVHKNQWFLNSLSPPYIPWGAIHHGTPHGA
jgi:hypothetical protein